MDSIIQEIHHSIKGINNVMTTEHLDTLNELELLANVHPLYRKAFAKRLGYENYS